MDAGAWRRAAGAGGRRGVAAVGLVAAGLALGACSSNATSGTQSTSSTTVTTATTSTTTVATTLAPTSSTTTSTTVVGPKPCSAGQLHLAKNDESGTAGESYLGIGITNSGADCILEGYPSVTLVGQSGAIETKVVHTGQGPAFQVSPSQVVVSGEGGGFVVAYSDVPENGEASCPKATAMVVTLPGITTAFRVDYELIACGGPEIGVSAVLTAPQEHAQFAS